MDSPTPTLQHPVDQAKPWRVVRYGLRSKSTIRDFRRRWTAHLYRVARFWSLLDVYKVEPNPASGSPHPDPAVRRPTQG
jgi:hypothetical protein